MNERTMDPNDIPKSFYKDKEIPQCFTVGQLITQLEKLPSWFPIAIDDEPVQAVIYNVMHASPDELHVTFETE